MKSQLPKKSLFRLNEVASLTGVKPYVLRFWESEFPGISPLVASSGHKMYSSRDVEDIMLIKKFLFEDGLNIQEAKTKFEGARQKGQQEQAELGLDREQEKEDLKNLFAGLAEVRKELELIAGQTQKFHESAPIT